MERLRRHVSPAAETGDATRRLLLFEGDFDLACVGEMDTGVVGPERLRMLPDDAPRQGWSVGGDRFGGCVWIHPEFVTGLWMHWRPPAQPTERQFWLPWVALVLDIVRLGGTLLHGGLAAHNGQAFLFAAPPGGGKTTALSRLPAPWQLLSDDAALVWRDEGGAFAASPLPTWGALLRGEGHPSYIDVWRLGERCRVAGLLLLEKSTDEGLDVIEPIRGARELYERIVEHPAVLERRTRFREPIFRLGCTLAREVPLRRLRLRRDSAFWGWIEDAF